MAGWPSLDRVDDHRIAQELRADGTTVLVQIYDVYAPRLFDYCHALLRDQELAADAVHDTLIAAVEHIGRLRQPERFRSWLFAIARNHCLRTLRDAELPGERRPAPEETDDAFVDPEERLRREETRRLVFSAIGGLSGRHREAVDLSIRHELSAEEIGGIVGLSSQQAIELVAEARDQLDNALAASIIARTGRADCPSVAALADEHEWPLPTDVCRKLIRHIGSCPICRERRKRKVSTNRLMQVMPIAGVPSDLRMAVLSLAAAADRNEDRHLIAQRAEPFDVWGWPVGVDRTRPAAETRTGAPKLLPALGAAAAVLLVAGGILLFTGGSFGGKPAGDASRPAAAGPGMPSGDPSASGSPDSPEPSPSGPPPTPTPTTHRPTPAPAHTATRPRPKPAPTPTRTKKTPKPPSGTLKVTSCTIPAGADSCGIMVRAVGGPVDWNVIQPSGVTVDRTSGHLNKAGATDTVTATRTGACDPTTDGAVTFSPSGTATISSNCGVLGVQ